jgi:hypothetical protein
MDMLQAPTARLAADDWIAIQELIAQFCHCSDFGDHEGLRALFTPDAVTEIDGDAMRYEGIEAVIAHSRKSEEVSGGKNRHYFFNFVIRPDGDGARARYCFLNANAGLELRTARIVTSGWMEDRLTRADDGWRICGRRVGFDQNLTLEW